MDVGAYLLGALDDAEMSAFEDHLAGCAECGRHLDELAGLLPVLDELRIDGAPPHDGADATGAGRTDVPVTGPDGTQACGTHASGPGAGRTDASRTGTGRSGTGRSGTGGGVRTGTGSGSRPGAAPRFVGLTGPPSGEDGLLDRLLAQVAAERGDRRRRRLVAVAAAAVLVVGGPVVAVLATQDGGGTPRAAATSTFAADRHTATNPATGVSALVGVADTGWGSVVDLKLTGVHGPLTCSLVAVGRDGSRQTVATWWVPNAGYGTQGQPAPLTVHGAAGLRGDAIIRFVVQTMDGSVLVSVPT